MRKDPQPVNAEPFGALPTPGDPDFSMEAIATRMTTSGVIGVQLIPVRHSTRESALILVRHALLEPETHTPGLQALAWSGEPYRLRRGEHAGEVAHSTNRDTAHYGQQYMYTDIAKPALPWPASGPIPILRSLFAQLIGVPLERVDQCSCNHNVAGKGMGGHQDKRDPLVVGSFSFLDSRRMRFCVLERSQFDDDLPTIILEPGSLLIFGKDFNEKFKHGIRDQTSAGQRISVIFRVFQA